MDSVYQVELKKYVATEKKFVEISLQIAQEMLGILFLSCMSIANTCLKDGVLRS